jgi:hypothetical protein
MRSWFGEGGEGGLPLQILAKPVRACKPLMSKAKKRNEERGREGVA